MIKDNGACLCLGYVNGLQCDSCKSEQRNIPNCSPSKLLSTWIFTSVYSKLKTSNQLGYCNPKNGFLEMFSITNQFLLNESKLISDGYPLKIKLSIIGEAQNLVGNFGGTYFLQEDTRNNKHYWIHQSGGKAIWWDNTSPPSWMVGRSEDLGSSRAGILGPSNNDSPPNQITSNSWQYGKDGSFHDTNDIHFEDWTFKQGKFLHLL